MLPEDVVLTDKEVHLGEVVDRVAGMIPGSIMTGSEGGVMLCVQTDTASEKEFGRVIDKLDFKGALSEFLHMCPGVAECSLSYGGSAPDLKIEHNENPDVCSTSTVGGCYKYAYADDD